MFICRKVDKSCGMFILSRVHLHEREYKVAVGIYLYVFIDAKVDIKLRYVCIITRSSVGKLI